MIHLLKNLEELGFNHHESQLYLYLLENGEMPASKIASATKIPRSTTRGLLDKLCERTVLKKIYKRNTQYYSCTHPKHLLVDLKKQKKRTEQRLENIKKELPLFKDIYNNTALAPKVQFFEGVDQVIEAFNHSLFQEQEELLFFTSYDFLQEKAFRKNDDEFFIPMRLKKNIPLRVLVGKHSEKKKKISSEPHELRQRRFIPKKFHLPGNIHIYGKYVVYFSVHKKEHFAVLIESPLMAQTMKTLFEFIWEVCG